MARLLAEIAVLILLLRYRIKPGHRIFKRIAEVISLIPGNFGLVIRNRFYARTLASCGSKVEFGFGTIVNYPDIHIGNEVSFGRYCNIGLADFGDYALIASHCQFLSGGGIHSFDDMATPIRKQAALRTRITVGEDVWVGCGAIVMASIDNHSVVGAGAVVTRPVGGGHIVAGNPARLIRTRGSERTGVSETESRCKK